MHERRHSKLFTNYHVSWDPCALLYNTRSLGRFAPIFYFNCERFLFVYIVKQKSNFVRGKYLKIRSSINLSWGHVRSHEKFGPNRFTRFDVYCIQTPRQAKYIYMNFSLLRWKKCIFYTVRNRKVWKRKTTWRLQLSVFNVVT